MKSIQLSLDSLSESTSIRTASKSELTQDRMTNLSRGSAWLLFLELFLELFLDFALSLGEGFGAAGLLREPSDTSQYYTNFATSFQIAPPETASIERRLQQDTPWAWA